MPPKLPLLTLLSAFSVCVVQTHVAAQGIVIANGGHVVVNGSAGIVINNGGFTNSGTFNAGTGIVFFTGATPATIAGTAPTSFYYLSVNKPGSTLTLLRNAGVTNTLSMDDGNIDLNGLDLDLGTTGIITGERPASRVLGPAGGFLVRSAVLNAPDRVNPGNIGIEITSASNPGLTTVRRGHQSLQLSGGFGIDRFFDITAANNNGNNATLRLHYFDEELGGVAENELGVYAIAVPGEREVLQKLNALNTTENTIETGNATLAGRWVPASNISDPARSSYFTATLPANNRTELNWGTFYEINASRFELQSAADGRSFQTFATVPASGTSTVSHDYTYIDPVELTSRRYYRYKLVFNDGTVQYSQIVSVSMNGYPNSILLVYPNVTRGPVNVRFSSIENQPVKLQVVNLNGDMVAQKEVSATTGLNNISCDISTLPPGSYFVRLVSPSRIWSYRSIPSWLFKIIKQ